MQEVSPPEDAGQMAYVKDRSCGLAILIDSITIEASDEPIMKFDADLRKAFDTLRQSIVGRMLCHAIDRGLHPIIAATLLREVSDRSAQAHISNICNEVFVSTKVLGKGRVKPHAYLLPRLTWCWRPLFKRGSKRGGVSLV